MVSLYDKDQKVASHHARVHHVDITKIKARSVTTGDWGKFLFIENLDQGYCVPEDVPVASPSGSCVNSLGSSISFARKKLSII